MENNTAEIKNCIDLVMNHHVVQETAYWLMRSLWRSFRFLANDIVQGLCSIFVLW
jgi:hypothetical protein